MYSDNLVIELNSIAHKYREQIDQSLHAVLNQPRYKNTGAGLASVHTEVIDGDANKAPEIIVTFDDHVGLLDKRKMQWTKMPPIDDLDQWTETKQFSGPVPGYKNGLAPNLPPWKQALRRTWAIAINKRKFDTWKARPWRKRSLSAILKDMNQVILQEFAKAIDMDIQKAIDSANG